MTYAPHDLTAMSSLSATKLVCDQFVACVLFRILVVLLMLQNMGMKVNNQSYQSSLQKENFILLAQEGYGI